MFQNCILKMEFKFLVILLMTFEKVSSFGCYVGQAITSPANQTSTQPVVLLKCTEGSDCITLYYDIIAPSTSISYIHGVCGNAFIRCPQFCTTMKQNFPTDMFKNCKCYSTKDENNKMKHFASSSSVNKTSAPAVSSFAATTPQLPVTTSPNKRTSKPPVNNNKKDRNANSAIRQHQYSWIAFMFVILVLIL